MICKTWRKRGPEPKTKDTIKARAMLKDFDYKNCTAQEELSRRYGYRTKVELLTIAQLVIQECEKLSLVIPQPGRNANRRKTILLKWFQDNFENISKVLDRIVLVDEDNVSINCIPKSEFIENSC